MQIYYQDEMVTLYHGDHRDVLPQLGQFDLVVADPPYAQTSLEWDHWQAGWPGLLAGHARSMWCFGSFRMFMDRRSEFSAWQQSQEIVWEKHNGSGFHADRFKRVHELAVHWYQGSWGDIYHETPTEDMAVRKTVRRKHRPTHMGNIEAGSYQSHDGGPLLMRSVIYARSMHGSAINETEKPTELLEPLISYACPERGTVLDPFGGSCSTAVAARALGRKSVLIEKRESQCEAAAQRLQQGVLDFGGAA